MNELTKGDLKTIIERAKVEHLRIFGQELVDGELNQFFSGLLEYKRRKWVEQALADHTAEQLITMLDILDEGQEPNGKA